MKSSDADILIIPGWSGSGPDHWQSRWGRARRLHKGSSRRIGTSLRAMSGPNAIVAAVRAATRPVVLVAHSAGVSAVAHAAEHLHPGRWPVPFWSRHLPNGPSAPFPAWGPISSSIAARSCPFPRC